MENKQPFIYEDVPLTFDLNGEEISGTLSGSFRWWQFRSNSPAFLRVSPNGLFGPGQYFIELREEHYNVRDGIQEAAEALGYSFEDPGNDGSCYGHCIRF